MSNDQTTILLIDDDPNNLEILVCYLEDGGYTCVTAKGAQEGLDLLQQQPHRFQTVLLDRMMPEMSGMEFLGQIKNDPIFSTLPIIMQTAAASPQEIQEGIDAGSFYYLTKPFTEQVLLALVKAAVRDFEQINELQTQVAKSSDIFSCLNSAEFHIQSPMQAQTLATSLANAYPDPFRVVSGLIELLLNGIEHGNLGISYIEKTTLIESGQWEKEIAHRLNQPEHAKKYVSLWFQRTSDFIEVTISDEGKGFNWQQQIDRGMDMACTTHGRGIAMAKMLSFDTLEYQGIGNVVRCIVNLHSSPDVESLHHEQASRTPVALA